MPCFRERISNKLIQNSNCSHGPDDAAVPPEKTPTVASPQNTDRQHREDDHPDEIRVLAEHTLFKLSNAGPDYYRDAAEKQRDQRNEQPLFNGKAKEPEPSDVWCLEIPNMLVDRDKVPWKRENDRADRGEEKDAPMPLEFGGIDGPQTDKR